MVISSNLDAWALLLGVGADKVTALHLAGHRAEYRGKRTVANAAPLLVEGVRQWFEWEELRLEDLDYVEVTSQFASSDTSARAGTVGQAPAQLLPIRPLVDFASMWFTAHR